MTSEKHLYNLLKINVSLNPLMNRITKSEHLTIFHTPKTQLESIKNKFSDNRTYEGHQNSAHRANFDLKKI